MTAATLRSYTCKDLAQMARSEGVTGWHSMRKDELITALVRVTRRKPTGKAAKASSKPVAKPAPERRTPAHIAKFQQQQAELKNLGASSEGREIEKDRLVVLVRDPYWLHACWELTAQSVSRAQSALGQHWHSAKPVLRVYRINEDGGDTLERTCEIHGGVTNWYVDVKDPPSSYRMEIGYHSPGTQFYCIARSNTVQTPAPGAADMVDRNWTDVAQNADRIYAMSGGYSADGASMELQELLEERLRRRLGRPLDTRYGNGAATQARTEARDFNFAIDTELIVYGSAEPNSHVTVSGEPVQVGSDGSFAVKLHLPDRRQVIPVVAGSSDGGEQKTIILGVERNTKVLDAVVRDVATC